METYFLLRLWIHNILRKMNQTEVIIVRSNTNKIKIHMSAATVIQHILNTSTDLKYKYF
jgi:hypothetical protein